MRTYDDLQSWHHKEIERSGLKVGDEVWFLDPFLKESVISGIITKFKIHWTGEDIIMCDVEYSETHTWEVNESIWVSDESKRRGTSTDICHGTVYFNSISRNKKDCLNFQISVQKSKIKRMESNIKYRERKIKKFKELRESD